MVALLNSYMKSLVETIKNVKGAADFSATPLHAEKHPVHSPLAEKKTPSILLSWVIRISTRTVVSGISWSMFTQSWPVYLLTNKCSASSIVNTKTLPGSASPTVIQRAITVFDTHGVVKQCFILTSVDVLLARKKVTI